MNDKKPWLFRVHRTNIGDYTTKFDRDYNEPLQGSLLNNQYFMESKLYFLFRGKAVHFDTS